MPQPPPPDRATVVEFLQEHHRKLRASQADATRRVLGMAPPERQAAAVAADAHRIADHIAAESPARERHACSKGCSWCCSQQVGVSPPEALVIAARLRRALPPDQLDAFRAQLRERCQRLAMLATATEIRRARLNCGFLGPDGSCAIHPVRPLVCRGFHSFSLTACQERHADPDRGQPPFDHLTHVSALALLDGQRDALTETGRDGGLLELHAAVLRALERDDQATRWAAGERVFDDVTVPRREG